MTNNREETAVSEEVELKRETCFRCEPDNIKFGGPSTYATHVVKTAKSEWFVCENCAPLVLMGFGETLEVLPDPRPAPAPAKDVEGLVGELKKRVDNYKALPFEADADGVRQAACWIANYLVEAPEAITALQSTAAQSQLINELEAALKLCEDNAEPLIGQDEDRIWRPAKRIVEHCQKALASIKAWREGK